MDQSRSTAPNHRGTSSSHVLIYTETERVPLAGSISLTGRQPEFYKYQGG